MDQERIIAVALLTRRDLDVLGPTFSRAWPVEEAPNFHELLQAIDEADQQLRQGDNAAAGTNRAEQNPGDCQGAGRA